MSIFQIDRRSGLGMADNAKQWNRKHQEAFRSAPVRIVIQ